MLITNPVEDIVTVPFFYLKCSAAPTLITPEMIEETPITAALKEETHILYIWPTTCQSTQEERNDSRSELTSINCQEETEAFTRLVRRSNDHDYLHMREVPSLSERRCSSSLCDVRNQTSSISVGEHADQVNEI